MVSPNGDKRCDSAGRRLWLAGSWSWSRGVWSLLTAFATLGLELVGNSAAQTAFSPAVVSQAVPLTTRELVEMRGLSSLAVSPDGTYAAVRIERQRLDRNSTELSWYVVRLRDGSMARVADAGAPMLDANGGVEAGEAPQWSEDERWIYYRALVGEQVQVWRSKRDGSQSEQLTHETADVLAFKLDAGGVLQYAIAGATRDEIKAAEQMEYDNGVLLDRTIIPGFPIVRSFPVNGRMATYRYLLPLNFRDRGTLLGSRPAKAASLELTTRRVRVAGAAVVSRLEAPWMSGAGRFWVSGVARFRSPGEGDSDGNEMVSSPDHSATARVTNRPSPTGGATLRSRSGTYLARRQTNSAVDLLCQDPVCTDSDGLAVVGWMDQSAKIVFQTLAFGTEGIRVWDTASNHVRTVIAGEGVFGALNSGAAGHCQLAGPEVVCIAGAADVPPRLIAIDLRNGNQRVIYNPNPSLTKDRLGVSEKIVLKDRFGGVAFGRLILPQAQLARPLPLVITSYTCPGFLLGGSGHDVPEHVFAGLGYASVCIDTSIGNMRRPPDFEATQEHINQSMLDLFEDAVQVLSQRGIVDSGRVALTGFSASATGATYALTQSKRFTAAIIMTETDMDPISYYLGNIDGGLRRLFKRSGEKLPYDSRSNEFYARNSAAWNVAKIHTPLLMQLSEEEHRDMMQLYAAMLDYGREVEMYIFPDEFHIKSQPRHRLAVYERNVDWVNFWLRGAESAAPARSKQYARWQVMRDDQCSQSGGEGMPDFPWYCDAAVKRAVSAGG